MTSKSKPKNAPKGGKSKSIQHKERGTAVTIVLVLMALHGIFATYFYYTVRTQEADLNRPMLLSLMVLHSLANVIAAVGIWYWKKWALYVYAASTIVAMVVGLLAVGAWSIFYMVLPFAIVGWVLRTKWDYFT